MLCGTTYHVAGGAGAGGVQAHLVVLAIHAGAGQPDGVPVDIVDITCRYCRYI